MARRPPNPQPSLALGLPRAKPESFVEYDRPARVRATDEPVFRRPEPPPSPKPSASVESAEAPWWDRANRVANAPTAAAPISFAKVWRGLLREADWTSDLPPAHAAILEAMVRGLDVRPGVVEAGVGASNERPHRVQLRLPPISPAEWARIVRHVVDAGAAETLFGEIDAGTVPLALIDGCDASSLTLAPRRLSLIVAACTCGAAKLPCDHVLATHLAFAREVGKRGAALLTFRGAPPEELRGLSARILDEVARAAAVTEAAPVDPFAAPMALAPDFESLSGEPRVRLPLPPLDGWRSAESLDAVCRRLLAPVRAAFSAGASTAG
jgi:hypothetical protein